VGHECLAKRSQIRTQKVHFLHLSYFFTKAAGSIVTSVAENKSLGCKLLQHAPYSPDLAHSDF